MNAFQCVRYFWTHYGQRNTYANAVPETLPVADATLTFEYRLICVMYQKFIGFG